MRSFREFLKNKHYNLICDAIIEYVKEHKHNLNISLRNISNIDKILTDDFDIKFVTSTNGPGLEIDFEVVVEAELEIYDYSKKHERTENTSQWFTCHCKGSLEDKLTEIQIQNVDEYSGVKHGHDCLSDSFIPYVKQKDLDEMAYDFLKKYYPKALLEPLKIDTTELAHSMGLTVITKKITTDGSIFGQLYFEDCNASFYDDNGTSVQEKITQNTIVLDPCIFYLRDVGSVNHTIVHECVHKEYHYKKYLFESIYDEAYSNIDCGIEGTTRRTSNESYMEWQANALAAHILMPENTFKRQASKYLKDVRESSGKFDLIDVLPEVIDNLADFFGVSRISAKIRLVEVGYEEAIGVYDYLDGKYLRPYSFSKGSLKPKQTFSVNHADAALLVFTNKNLKTLVEQGAYIYAESHFVINSPKYICHTGSGPMLTDYAIKHMDECCLVFDLVISGTDNGWHATFYLNRSDHSPISFEVKYNDGLQNSQDVAKKNEVLSNNIRENCDIYRQLSNDFVDSVNRVMKWRGLNQKQIAEKTSISTKTVSRALSGDHIDINTVILICLALQVPYLISEKLLDNAGYKLTMSNPTHQFYWYILTYMYAEPIDAINNYLDENHIARL
jgi:transcriptional regulator with XRE-family HTH domain